MSQYSRAFVEGYLAGVGDMGSPGALACAIYNNPGLAATHAFRDREWTMKLPHRGNDGNDVVIPAAERIIIVASRTETEVGAVYIAEDPAMRVKIGFTGGDVQRRLRQVECAAGVTLTLLGMYPGTRQLELALHEKFADLRLEGEWFQGDERIDRWVRSWQK